MPKKVFISYSTEDKAITDKICHLLENNEIDCWIAPRDIPPSGNYGKEIIRAIKSCQVLVLILSSHSNNSEHVKNEVERGVNSKKAVFVFRVENVKPSEDLELFIARSQWNDVFNAPLEATIKKTSQAIKASIQDTASQPAPDSPEFQAQPAAPGRLRSITLPAAAIAAAVVIAALSWFVFMGKTPPPSENSNPRAAVTAADGAHNREHMQAVLKALTEKYREQLSGKGKPDAVQASSPLSLSLIGFTGTGAEQKELADYFMAKLSQELVSGGSLRLVEREKLSEILDELKLSNSDIADQDSAMIMLGRLVGAQLIGSGKIITLRGETTVSLRVFETATSQIIISLSEELKENNSAEVVGKLSRSLTQQLEKRYPPKEKQAAVSQ